MDADRTEQHDLAGEHTEIINRLQSAWDAWVERDRILPLGAWRGKQ